MSGIERLRADHYVIPLDTVLTDSMHGKMAGFEIVTARATATDTDGAEAGGYTFTFTCGVNGHAIACDGERLEALRQ